MHNVMKVLQELVESGDDLRLLLYKGPLKPMGNYPASEVKFTNAGSPMWKGAVSAHCTVFPPNGGDSFEFDSQMPFVAFGEAAEPLLALEEGQEVLVLAEYNRRKMDNGGYWNEGQVLALDILS